MKSSCRSTSSVSHETHFFAMASLCQSLSPGRLDSLPRSVSLNKANVTGHDDNVDEYPLHEFHRKPSNPEDRSLLMSVPNSRRDIRQYLRFLIKRDEERPPWAPGVWSRLPVAGLAALIGVLLRKS
jgi:hypothetical protein